MTSKQEKLVLCGCGWLGGYLASHFRSNLTIYGTTRTEQKARELSAKGIKPVTFTLGGSLDELLTIAPDSIFILNIPPGRRNTDLTSFTAAMTRLIRALYTNKPPKQLIFISTTSVYGDLDGRITTHSPVQPNTASGEAHVLLEREVLKQAPETGYVLRLAGLTGPDRHPVNTLAGRTLSGATQVVNLVHVEDVVRVIEALIRQQPATKLWQLCSNEHPMRGEYYPKLAEQLGLTAIEFTDELTSQSEPTGKTIDAGATLAALNLSLDYPTPWSMLPE